MALQFVLGNSGSGKTEYMYQQVVKKAKQNPKQNFLIIVPEQFTMQTQRKMVDLSENSAIMNIDILSFQRLAFRVFDELGMNKMQILEETGKNLVLRKIAQEKEDKLSVLRGSMHRMGYIGEMKSLISEFMQYNVSPKQLEESLADERLSSVLSAKLRDVHVMYQGFLDFLEGNYITAEEVLHVLAKVSNQSKFLKGSVLVFDEFTGFTPVQGELLKKLMPICSEIRVSLTIDEKENFFYRKGIQDLFDMPKRTIQVLMDLAKHTHTEVLEPVILSDGDKKRFQHAPSLYFMEQNLFRTSYKRMFGTIHEIEMYCLKTPKEELILAARKINELVRTKGLRYRDIAVVSGDVETYGNYVEQVCKKYEIPYFLDMTKEVLFHPFIEFIRGILLVIDSDFSYQAMMRLLRSGFCQIPQEEIDKLENYLLATGIRGKKMWSGRWIRKTRKEKMYDLDALNEIRQKIMEGLRPVADVFAKKESVEAEIKALYQYITELEVEKQLYEREKELLEEGELAKAKEYEQIYKIVMDLFEKCITVIGKEHLSIQELGEILDAGFEAAKVAVIPPVYDSVTIGDIERTRLNHVKVLIFLGVNEGIIPKAVSHGGIISQYERELLEAAEISLSAGAREQAFIQKFYLYLNMTKPSQKLIVSYSRVDSEGKALRPSYLVRTILRMFPDMEVKEIEELDKIPNFSTLSSAKEYYLSGERDAQWYALANCLVHSEDEVVRSRAKAILDAFYYAYRHDPISHVAAEAIYGKQMEGSVTRLENFAKCAYAHFLSYGLKLREREENGFESVDMGNLYHAALENYSKMLAESPYNWKNIPDEVRDSFAQSAMEEAVLSYSNVGIYATAENTHMATRMQNIFRQTLWALTMQIRKGNFIPNEFEISFSKEDKLDALSFRLEDGNRVQLKGRIDRLDTCIQDDQIYIKIVDYKSGNTKFDLLKLYYGVQLQLVVYMNAAMEIEKKQHPLKKVVPAGMFYYHIDDPVIEVTSQMTEQEVQEAMLKELKPDGLVNKEEAIYRAMDEYFEKKSDVIPIELKKTGEPTAASSVATTEEFEILSEYVNHSIVRQATEIYEGNVDISPFMDGDSLGCDYCSYQAVCGFDKKIAGFKERKAPKIDKKDVFEKMEKENAISRLKEKKK